MSICGRQVWVWASSGAALHFFMIRGEAHWYQEEAHITFRIMGEFCFIILSVWLGQISQLIKGRNGDPQRSQLSIWTQTLNFALCSFRSTYSEEMNEQTKEGSVIHYPKPTSWVSSWAFWHVISCSTNYTFLFKLKLKCKPTLMVIMPLLYIGVGKME